MLFGYFLKPVYIFITEVIYLAKRKAREAAKESPLLKSDISQMVINRQPHIEMEGNRTLLVDGCKGILEYETDRIKINADKAIIGVTGDELSIAAYNDDLIIINGKILTVDFS